MGELLNIFLKSVFIENMVLSYFLGMCSFLAVSKSVKTAVGLGAAVIFVLTLTSPINWFINYKILGENGMFGMDLTFLRFILFIATIAATVQLVEMIVEKFFSLPLQCPGYLPSADYCELCHPWWSTLYGCP